MVKHWVSVSWFRATLTAVCPEWWPERDVILTLSLCLELRKFPQGEVKVYMLCRKMMNWYSYHYQQESTQFQSSYGMHC